MCIYIYIYIYHYLQYGAYGFWRRAEEQHDKHGEEQHDKSKRFVSCRPGTHVSSADPRSGRVRRVPRCVVRILIV